MKRSATLRQQAFIREYVKDFNGTQAALRAGYSSKCARHFAYRLLKQPEIQQAVHEKVKRITDKSDVTIQRVLTELARIAFSQLHHSVRVVSGRVVVTDTDAMTEDQRAAMAEIAETEAGVRVKMHDKTRALELLGKYLALFTDRTEVTGADGGPLVVVRPPEPKT